jgi:hypothetical protein
MKRHIEVARFLDALINNISRILDRDLTFKPSEIIKLSPRSIQQIRSQF